MVTLWPHVYCRQVGDVGHPVGHCKGDDDVGITNTAADRVNKSWILKEVCYSYHYP